VRLKRVLHRSVPIAVVVVLINGTPGQIWSWFVTEQ
jgi:hypothetical protein